MGDREERDLLRQSLLELRFGRTYFNKNSSLLINFKVNINTVHLYSLEPSLDQYFYLRLFVCLFLHMR